MSKKKYDKHSSRISKPVEEPVVESEPMSAAEARGRDEAEELKKPSFVSQELVEGEPKDGWKTFLPKPVEEPKKEEKPIRYWHGQRIYDCPSLSCPFDALEEETVRKHFKKVHGTPPAPSKGNVVLTDRFGNALK